MWVLRLLRSHQVHQALEDRMYGHQRYETAHCVRELLYLGMAGPNGRGVCVCVCVCVCVGEKLRTLVRENTDKTDILKCLWQPPAFAGHHRF